MPCIFTHGVYILKSTKAVMNMCMLIDNHALIQTRIEVTHYLMQHPVSAIKNAYQTSSSNQSKNDCT